MIAITMSSLLLFTSSNDPIEAVMYKKFLNMNGTTSDVSIQNSTLI